MEWNMECNQLIRLKCVIFYALFGSCSDLTHTILINLTIGRRDTSNKANMRCINWKLEPLSLISLLVTIEYSAFHRMQTNIITGEIQGINNSNLIEN